MRILILLFLVTLASACGNRQASSDLSTIRDAKRFPLKKRETIVVDAGHGGKDSGSTSKRDGYEEKALTLQTAHMICNCLQQLGYKTYLTRSDDTFIPLSTRAEIANGIEADLFVSIHYNYSANSEAKGIEVYTYKEGKTPSSGRILASKTLADHVLKRVLANTGASSRGLKQENFAVIRETKMPAILVEAGFLSNPQERERVHDPKYQYSIARGIASGVDQYLQSR